MKRKVVVSGTIILSLGTILLILSIAPLETRTQIGYKENPSPWSTSLEVFLEQGQLCRLEIIVEASEVGKDYNLSIAYAENDSMFTSEHAWVQETVFIKGFRAPKTGNYTIDWHWLLVSQITAYRIGDLIPKHPVSEAGVLVFTLGIISFIVFELKELSEAEKTRLFWEGLMILCFTVVELFVVFWWGFVLNFGITYYPASSVIWALWHSVVPAIFGGIVFLLIGFYMMRSGVKKRTKVA